MTTTEPTRHILFYLQLGQRRVNSHVQVMYLHSIEYMLEVHFRAALCLNRTCSQEHTGQFSLHTKLTSKENHDVVHDTTDPSAREEQIS